MLTAYLNALKNWSPEGRSSRRDFWLFMVPHAAIIVAIYLGSVVASQARDWLQWGLLAYIVATAWPFIALHVRRLHDIGRSGWWVLVWWPPIVPLVAFVINLVGLMKASDDGPNRYGEPPVT